MSKVRTGGRECAGEHKGREREKRELPVHLAVGAAGEEAAAAYLHKQGLRILDRNWRPGRSAGSGGRGLELDIVAVQGGELVFVEVKTRQTHKGLEALPADNFTAAKRVKLRRAASFYLSEKQAWDSPCRFDLVCVELDPDGAMNLEHFENVL
ncbi:MAG: YraN family protein [Deltaproteobacteria bacterium]|nr:YraN family protein [Deltaproteobacteria bacterium]